MQRKGGGFGPFRLTDERGVSVINYRNTHARGGGGMLYFAATPTTLINKYKAAIDKKTTFRPPELLHNPIKLRWFPFRFPSVQLRLQILSSPCSNSVSVYLFYTFSSLCLSLDLGPPASTLWRHRFFKSFPQVVVVIICVVLPFLVILLRLPPPLSLSLRCDVTALPRWHHYYVIQAVVPEFSNRKKKDERKQPWIN